MKKLDNKENHFNVQVRNCNSSNNFKSDIPLYEKKNYPKESNSLKKNKFENNHSDNKNSCWTKDKLKNYFIEFFFVELGINSIFIFTKYSLLNSVYSLSCMVLIVSSMFPKYGIIFLCGAFSSVMNPDTLNNPGFLFLSGFVSLIFYNITKGLFLNIGGRPGIISFISNIITFAIVYLISFAKTYKYEPMDYLIDYSYFNSLNLYIFIFGPIFSLISSLAVNYVAEYIKDLVEITSRLLAYSIVCVFGCMFLLSFAVEFRKIPNNITQTYGQMFINFWHVGCLVGLTIKTRFHREGKYQYFFYAIVGYFSGLITIGLLGVLTFGGKHGICAFLANVIFIYIKNWLFEDKKIDNEVDGVRNSSDKTINLKIETKNTMEEKPVENNADCLPEKNF